MTKSNGQILLLQSRLFLDCSLIRAQRRFTMKRLMSWSHHSGPLMLPLAPQLLLLVLRNKPRKWNLSQTLQNQNLCRTVQNPAQLQRSVWESPLQPVLSGHEGMNALLRAPAVVCSFPPGCLKKTGKTREESEEEIEKALDAHVCQAHFNILLSSRRGTKKTGTNSLKMLLPVATKCVQGAASRLGSL